MELLCSLFGSKGEAIPAGIFVPIGGQYGLLAALDIKVIERAFPALERLSSLPWTVSVNVSMQSIGDDGFRAALTDLLRRNNHLAWRLVVEITGFAASRLPDLVKALAAELRGIGVHIALDNFDVNKDSMAIVHELLPTYIKLAPSFIKEIATREDLRSIVAALVRMLRPLNIPLIAQGVEDVSTIPLLAELGLEGYQSYGGGRPEPLPDN